MKHKHITITPALFSTKEHGWIFTPNINTSNPSWTILDLEDEEKWGKAFADSQDKLAEWAREVIKGIDEGKSEPMDFDRLGE